MLDRTPRVFISYSWSSEEYREKVKSFAERLVHDGVDVKFDQWDLKDGQDIHAFMEKCTTDESIDKVLIFSDRIYTEKANNRQGGVGEETTIISPEVYGNAEQQKFIPIVMERDGAGNAYLPAYLKGKKYRDFSGDYDANEYENLIRAIFDAPKERKPELGHPPMWLFEEPSELYPIKEAVKRVTNADIGKLKNVAARDFIDTYIDSIIPFYENALTDPKVYLDVFSSMLEYRNVFLDYLRSISAQEGFGRFIADSFEKLYNTLCYKKTYVPDARSSSSDEFDIYKLHIWELFICTTAYMLHAELYADIHEMLYHTYYLRVDGLSERTIPVSYEGLRFHSRMIEEIIKPQLKDELRRKYTLVGHYIVNDREYLPHYTGKALANADLFLYQVYNGMGLEKISKMCAWFPTLYVYADPSDSFWKKLSSVQFCSKVMPVFGVESIADLKDRLINCKTDYHIRYSKGFVEPAPAILSYITIDEIGSLP